MLFVPVQLSKALEQCVKLKRFKDAWNFCKHLNSMEAWQQMGKAAMRALDIDFGESYLPLTVATPAH